MRKFNNHSGFSLIELSIVLVIIGLLVGLGGGMIGPLTTFVKVRETRDIMGADLQSIISWTSSRNTIPHALSTTDPLYDPKTAFTTVVKSPLDAWGRNLIYLYDANLYSVAPTKDTICGRRSTGLTLVTTDPTATINNVAFTVLSAADNTALKSTLGGAPITASNAATGTINVTGPNSDLVRWVTLDELRSKIGCQGAPLKIVNNELPYANYSTSYSATIIADGGNGSENYQWRIKKGIFPAGITATSLPFTNISTTDWAPATTLTIQGYPKPQGSYFFSILVRDTIGNSNSKAFVLTVNPRSY
jgi:prepilin-type N-terminal cleavage/methylation domain-containing protein